MDAYAVLSLDRPLTFAHAAFLFPRAFAMSALDISSADNTTDILFAFTLAIGAIHAALSVTFSACSHSFVTFWVSVFCF